SRRDYVPQPGRAGVLSLDEIRRGSGELARNSSASLLDLGESVLGLEFHSKANTIDLETMEMIRRALSELEKDRWLGMVIGNQGDYFSAGANIGMMAMAIQSRQFDQLEQMQRTLHGLMQDIRFSPKPVVVAPFGRTLGGGTEIC